MNLGFPYRNVLQTYSVQQSPLFLLALEMYTSYVSFIVMLLYLTCTHLRLTICNVCYGSYLDGCFFYVLTCFFWFQLFNKSLFWKKNIQQGKYEPLIMATASNLSTDTSPVIERYQHLLDASSPTTMSTNSTSSFKIGRTFLVSQLVIFCNYTEITL